MKATPLGLLLRLHIFIVVLLILGVLLYAVGGFQGFLPSTQASLLALSQYLSVAGALSGLYLLIAAVATIIRTPRRGWGAAIGALLSSALCLAVSVATLFFDAMIATA